MNIKYSSDIYEELTESKVIYMYGHQIIEEDSTNDQKQRERITIL